MSEILCDNCGQPMTLEKKFETKQRGKARKKYRVRRFKCTWCDITKTVFADGYRDEEIEPIKAKAQVKAIFKKERESRK